MVQFEMVGAPADAADAATDLGATVEDDAIGDGGLLNSQ
jgi:hypothetical protein